MIIALKTIAILFISVGISIILALIVDYFIDN